jgi:phage shock protein A
MKKALLPCVGVVVTALLLSSLRADTQQLTGPVSQAAQPTVAALEAHIAQLEVERLGLMVEWQALSTPVRAANKKLLVLNEQLRQARPSNPSVSVEAKQKAIQAKIAQLESVRTYLAGRYQANHLKTEQKYVTNYLNGLRDSLSQVRSVARDG